MCATLHETHGDSDLLNSVMVFMNEPRTSPGGEVGHDLFLPSLLAARLCAFLSFQLVGLMNYKLDLILVYVPHRLSASACNKNNSRARSGHVG